MGLPNIIIEFKSKASTAVRRGERGVVAVMLLEEGAETTVTKLEDITQMPEDLSEANKAYLQRTFLGGQRPVRYVQLIRTDSVENGLPVLETIKFDYFAAPPEVTEKEVMTISIYFKTLRDNKKIRVKAVLPHCKADHESVINFTTDGIKVGDDTYSAAEYCSRIAGMLAGTPLNVSCTYYVLSEVDDVPRFSKSELNERIDKGEFLIFHDGEKVKVGREINSLQTLGQNKGRIYTSIKGVDTMDMIYNDIHDTVEEVYIGKFANNYDNKCLIIVAIQTYLETLRNEAILDDGITVDIDLERQTMWLKENGVAVADMTEQEIKEANTESYVFLMGRYKILYAIEDVEVVFEI